MNVTTDIELRNGLDLSIKNRPSPRKTHSIPIQVKRYFTTVDGAVIAKGAAPAAMQVDYPFYLFGDYDRQGGYANGLKIIPPDLATPYVMSFVSGYPITSQQITGFSGLSTVHKFIKTGDIVHVFTDSLEAPTFFVWIVQSSRNGGLGSIVGNTSTIQDDKKIGTLWVDHFQYFTDNMNPQWDTPVHFTQLSNISTWLDNQVMPMTFKTPYTEQDGFVRMECKFNLDQYQAIATKFLYATDLINLNFCIINL